MVCLVLTMNHPSPSCLRKWELAHACARTRAYTHLLSGSWLPAVRLALSVSLVSLGLNEN